TDRSTACPVIWDDLVCWDMTSAGAVARKSCPGYINGFNKNAYVTKFCTEDGIWWNNPSTNHSWTNYTECIRPSIDLSSHAAHGDKLRLLYTVGYSFSLGSLLVAFIIMLCCKRLHSKSNTLHINLFLAFIFRASISFLKDILFVQNLGLAKDVRRGDDGALEFVQDVSHWECKLIMSIFMYSVNACNMWIFVEALYLTMLVSRPLFTERRGLRMYMILGWSLPLLFIIPWILLKALYEDTFCWNIQSNPDYYWILRGSGVGVVVKYGQLLYICVCRRLAKFILVLIPLFGIMYIVFYVAMPSNFEETEFNVTYLYLEMGYNSFQGFLLALLFCFLNEEVHGELKRMWQRHRKHRLTMSAIRSDYFHSNNRLKHSIISRDSQESNKMAPLEVNNKVPHKKQKQSQAISASYENVHDMSSSKSKTDTFKPHCQISSTAKGATFQTARSANKVALSLCPNLRQPDSLLKQAVRTNAHRRLLGSSNALETAASIPSSGKIQ
ncbi:unnamed protein product, partial [Candidula unifasciata]